MAIHVVSLFMVGKAYVAKPAPGYETAISTFDEKGKSPAVLKENNLFLIGKRFCNTIEQSG
jgi:hypothetical protein